MKPTITVIDGGLLTTVQDLGRHGYQRYGVPVSGAMDQYAMRIGNILVGNDEGSAVLEITLLGPTLMFSSKTRVAITGSDLGATVDGNPIGSWRSIDIPKGSTMSFRGGTSGVRGYLAISGGIDVPKTMGSRSTSIRESIGGYAGRPLGKGDRISTFGSLSNLPLITVSKQHQYDYSDIQQVRVILGPQEENFTKNGVETFLSESYKISNDSNRIGIRLVGPKISHKVSADIISDGTTFGSVQIPGDGMPIILMADRGTTGGYAKIATVITPDLWKVSQVHPGSSLTFKPVSVEKAIAIYRKRETEITDLKVLIGRLGKHHVSSPRILVHGQAYMAHDNSDKVIAGPTELVGEFFTSRQSVRVTSEHQSYTFSVELQVPFLATELVEEKGD